VTREQTAVTALLALVVANFVLQPLTEPDFGWHLRAGLDLLSQGGRLPALDPYSHTMPDWPWVEHAWLTDLLIGLLYQAGGPLAAMLFFSAVTAAAWLIAVRSSEANAPVQLSACALSLWAALPFLGARTQMVTLLGLAFLMWGWHRVRAGEVRLVRWIPPLFLVWANLHGGFTAGLFFLGLVIALSWLVRLTAPDLAQRTGVADPSTLWRLLLATGTGAIMTLVNPYGWNLHKEIFDSLSDSFMIQTLREWHPVSLETLAGRLFVGYVAGLALAMMLWYRRMEPVQWGVLAVFLVLAGRHLRNIPLFLIVSVPLAADLLHEALRRFAALPFVKAVSPTRWLRAGTLALGLVLLYLGPDHIQHVWRFGVTPAAAFRQTSYPIEAVEWIREHRHQLGARLLHDYQYGGFLLWWLPQEKIFIDGRMPAWRIGDRWIFKDYVEVRETDPPRLSILDKYGVDWALLKRDTVLAQILGALPGWRKAYEDAKVVIYMHDARRLDGTIYSRTAEEARGESRRAASASE
jgi:hypothetical protein